MMLTFVVQIVSLCLLIGMLVGSIVYSCVCFLLIC